MGALARVLDAWKGDQPSVPCGKALPDLSWVGEWIANVRDYIHVREEDSLFIQRPNKAFKLNPQGIRIMTRLLAGEDLEVILGPHARNPQARQDVDLFLRDLRKLLKDGLEDTYDSPAVTKIPFTMAFSRFPVLSEVAVTYRCNAACTFCYAGCNCTTNPVGNERQMQLEEVKRVLEKIRNEAKVPSVSFTGGEATLREDLPEMIRHARGLGMRVNLITNGILPADGELAKRLAAAGLHSAQVSIQGTTAEVHESATRVPRSFSRAVQAVHNFTKADVRVNTNTTVTRANLDDMINFPAFVKGTLGIKAFSMNLVIPTGSAPINEGLVVRYREIGPYLVNVQKKAQALGVEFIWYSPTPMCIFNPITHGLGNKGCAACDGLISVGADGQVLPCASFDKPVGDLLQQPFEEIWNGPEATAFRGKSSAHELCRTCENFHICNGACPLYWRQVGYDELTEAVGMRSDEAVSNAEGLRNG